VSWKTSLPHHARASTTAWHAWLPALEEHHCGVGERGGFLQRLQEGTWCGHILEHVASSSCSTWRACPPASARRAARRERGVYRMVFRARDEQVGTHALAGPRLLMAAINDRTF
jgi:cyanophycin synthetase